MSLSEFKGKVVVIDFWATWCSWCRKTTQELEKIHKDYTGKGVVIVGISMDTGHDAGRKVTEFAGKYGLSYPMLLDDGKVSRQYGINKIPTSLILNEEHIITRIYPGYLPGLGERIVDAIEESLLKPRGSSAGGRKLLANAESRDIIRVCWHNWLTAPGLETGR